MKTYSIGIDPDLHTLPIALVSAEEGKAKLEGIWTVKAKGSQKEEAVQAIIQELNTSLQGGLLYGTFPVLARPFCSVESQNVSYTGKTNAANPQDLIYLAQVAGACAYAFYGELVQPFEWKKTMPKKIVQARCFSNLDIPYRIMGGSKERQQYCVPLDFQQYDRTGNLNAGDFKDAGDSIALAYWRLKKEWKVK